MGEKTGWWKRPGSLIFKYGYTLHLDTRNRVTVSPGERRNGAFPRAGAGLWTGQVSHLRGNLARIFLVPKPHKRKAIGAIISST